MRIDVLDKIREERIEAHTSSEGIRLQLGEIRHIEHRHGTHPPTCSTELQTVSTELVL